MTYRTMFTEAVGEIPPTSIDVDRIMARQRRVIRLRRIGVVVAAAVAVGAVTVGAVSGIGRPRTEVPVAPAPSIPAVHTPPPQQRRPFTQLDIAVFEAVHRVAPDLEWVNWNSGPGTRGYEPKVWMGQGEIRSGARAGTLVLQFSYPDWGKIGPCTAELVKRGCVTRTGPGGELIQTVSTRNPDAGLNRAKGAVDKSKMTLTNSMLMERPDGRVLIVDLHGDDENPPLTLEQLTALALDPAVAKVATDPFRYDPNARRMAIDAKFFAALRREVPGVKGAVGVPPKYSPAPDIGSFWSAEGGKNTDDDYWIKGRIFVGKVLGPLTVEMHRRDPGTAGELTGTGPNGERFHTSVNGSGPSATQVVEVLRTDGTWLAVTLSANEEGRFALTAAQQEAIAFDTAIALPTK